MRTVELSEEERQLVLRLAGLEWQDADKERMKTRPDSLDERTWLEYQRILEVLQAKLR